MKAPALIAAQLAGAARAVPAWAEWIAGLADHYDDSRHGDYARWAHALEDLPNRLEDLHPWRKGPWRFGDVTVDTEWRSDWKWQRLAPHIDLTDHTVLDIGCGNGYFGWRMLAHGARAVLGIDPTLVFCMQHLAATALLGDAPNYVLPARLEDVPPGPRFDTVLSMGVLYHRKAPVEHIRSAASFASQRVIVETLIVDSEHSLFPEGRYARMRNVPVVPSVVQVLAWMNEAGLRNARCVDITPTSTEEQRSTPWMRFESLAEALDDQDPTRTVEGHPAPVRAIFIAEQAG